MAINQTPLNWQTTTQSARNYHHCNKSKKNKKNLVFHYVKFTIKLLFCSWLTESVGFVLGVGIFFLRDPLVIT
jgi:hypothetical protein